MCFFYLNDFLLCGMRHSMAGSGLIDHGQRSTELSGFDKRW